MRFPQAFSVTSNYGFSHGNAGAEAFRRSFTRGADLGNTGPNIDLNSFNLGQTRLNLNERMVQVRRSYVDPKRVEIKSRIDYLPQPDQTMVALTERIKVTEVIRTEEIVRTKFIQSSFSNDVTQRLNERLGRPAFEDQVNNQQQDDTRLQIYNPNDSSLRFGLNIKQTNQFAGNSDRSLSYRNNDQQVDQVIDLDPISMYFNDAPEEKLDFNYRNLTLKQPKSEPGFANQVNSFPPIASMDEDDEEDQNENNYKVRVRHGRTHSLPHRKYGPYTCPRCRKVFVTSQLFAAHMGSHYRRESENERTRTGAARNKGKHLHLLHTKYGLTILPKSFKPSEAKNKWRKSTLWIPNEESDGEEKKALVAGDNGGFNFDGLFGVGVKLQLP